MANNLPEALQTITCKILINLPKFESFFLTVNLGKIKVGLN
jgi:hypothetical protein